MRVGALILWFSLTLFLCLFVFHAQAQSLQTAQDQRQTWDWPHDTHYGKSTLQNAFFFSWKLRQKLRQASKSLLRPAPCTLGSASSYQVNTRCFISWLVLGFMSTNKAPICVSSFHWNYKSAWRCSAGQQNIFPHSPEIPLQLWRAWKVWCCECTTSLGAVGSPSAPRQRGISEVSPAQKSIKSYRGVCQFCSLIQGEYFFPPCGYNVSGTETPLFLSWESLTMFTLFGHIAMLVAFSNGGDCSHQQSEGQRMLTWTSWRLIY